MGGLEAGLIGLVILFYIVRAVYRGLRWLVLGTRRALGAAPAPPAARPTPPVATPPPARPAPVPRPELRPRRPEAGAAAVPQPAADSAFRAQVAQMEATQDQPSPRPAERAPRPAKPGRITLRPDGNDLVRALIWQEILSPPRAHRNPRK